MTTNNVLQNPYVKGAEGRREWNDRYMNMARAIRNWQLAFFASLVIVSILAVALVQIATESKVQPYVVETTQGMPYAIKPVTAISTQDQRLINYAMNQFILNAKTVLADTDAEKLLLNKVYAFAADNSLSFLHEYYQKNNPFTLVSQFVTSVNIVNSLPLSNHTWQLTWDEVQRSASSGNVVSTTRWMANIHYQIGDINPKFMLDNPFGIYITDISWAPSHIA